MREHIEVTGLSVPAIPPVAQDLAPVMREPPMEKLNAINRVYRTTRLQLDRNQSPADRLEVENGSRHEPELPAKGFRDGDLATFRNFCLNPALLV